MKRLFNATACQRLTAVVVLAHIGLEFHPHHHPWTTTITTTTPPRASPTPLGRTGTDIARRSNRVMLDDIAVASTDNVLAPAEQLGRHGMANDSQWPAGCGALPSYLQMQ